MGAEIRCLLLVDSRSRLPSKVILNNAPLIGHFKSKAEEAMRLRRNQLCPIHRSHFCCGREQIPREKRQRQMGVRRIEDPHHPRGYRELRSNGEMRKLLDRKIVAQNGKCALCKERSPITATSCPTTSIPAAWAERGETIILKTSRLSIGGAMGKRDRAEGDLWPVRYISLAP